MKEVVLITLSLLIYSMNVYADIDAPQCPSLTEVKAVKLNMMYHWDDDKYQYVAHRGDFDKLGTELNWYEVEAFLSSADKAESKAIFDKIDVIDQAINPNDTATTATLYVNRMLGSREMWKCYYKVSAPRPNSLEAAARIVVFIPKSGIWM